MHRAAVFKELDQLGRGGELALAHVVMANTMLFEPGRVPASACVVFTLAPDRRFDEEYLARMASAIAELRVTETRPGPELSDLWTWIRNDLSAGAVPLTPSLAGNTCTFLCDVVVNPTLLHDGKLSSVPLLVLADVHPKRYLTATLLHL
jgi:hypothetical protein